MYPRHLPSTRLAARAVAGYVSSRAAALDVRTGATATTWGALALAVVALPHHRAEHLALAALIAAPAPLAWETRYWNALAPQKGSTR